MSYASISRWKLATSFDDAALTEAATMYIGALKELGADSATMVRMSPTDGLLISFYPDESARDAARDRVVAMMKDRMASLPVELTEEIEGPVLTTG